MNNSLTKFISYQHGINKLLDLLGKQHPSYLNATTFQHRLQENINYVERYGDNENYRSTRHEILYQIDKLALENTGNNFAELCQMTPIQIGESSPRYQEAVWQEYQEPEMSFIPPGSFIMGSPPELDANAFEDEYPLHIVELSAFYIATTCVTNLQYAVFINNTKHTPPEHWQNTIPPKNIYHHPVVNISWYSANEFCEWLSQLTQKSYRLPTEAEWEKAARGVNASLFPWGNQWQDNSANTREYNNNRQRTLGVDELPHAISPYDVLNMAGNVSEWTSSLWGRDNPRPEFPYPYVPTDSREAVDAPPNILRIIRGGSFLRDKRYARCACRDKLFPKSTRKDVGFRLALSSVFLR
ncbi:MAG: SUMF1/EgtB/PvdO family nonheme iron enzyme [Aulosira sp. DedQUE10]|nr:SUMF1/EgtB/PvdO family nonheme iron enzyme [Aulosira sp. DedQUE10]